MGSSKRNKEWETYCIGVVYNNCGEYKTVQIPKGTTQYDYFRFNIVECKRCGCSVRCRTGPVLK